MSILSKTKTTVAANVSDIAEGCPVKGAPQLRWWTASVVFNTDRHPIPVQLMNPAGEAPPAEHFLAAAVGDALRLLSEKH